jgi:integrative and conjugative element protein (TIGR02256 family)
LILKNEEIDLFIDIPDKLLKKLRMEGLKHYPNEFGGIFIGNYSDDKKTALIKETLLPKKYKSNKYSFERGSEGLKEKLTHYYNQPNQLVYLGEWHTHPNGAINPSITDINAFKEIVKDEDVYIFSPIMLIVGLTTKKMELGFYVYFKNKLYKYETV